MKGLPRRVDPMTSWPRAGGRELPPERRRRRHPERARGEQPDLAGTRLVVLPRARPAWRRRRYTAFMVRGAPAVAGAESVVMTSGGLRRGHRDAHGALLPRVAAGAGRAEALRTRAACGRVEPHDPHPTTRAAFVPRRRHLDVSRAARRRPDRSPRRRLGARGCGRDQATSGASSPGLAAAAGIAVAAAVARDGAGVRFTLESEFPPSRRRASGRGGAQRGESEQEPSCRGREAPAPGCERPQSPRTSWHAPLEARPRGPPTPTDRAESAAMGTNIEPLCAS